MPVGPKRWGSSSPRGFSPTSKRALARPSAASEARMAFSSFGAAALLPELAPEAVELGARLGDLAGQLGGTRAGALELRELGLERRQHARQPGLARAVLPREVLELREAPLDRLQTRGIVGHAVEQARHERAGLRQVDL